MIKNKICLLLCASALFLVGCNNITDNEAVNIDSTEPIIKEVDKNN
jgi:PBP1b-binding outer membrane lipoprotein LpoB